MNPFKLYGGLTTLACVILMAFVNCNTIHTLQAAKIEQARVEATTPSTEPEPSPVELDTLRGLYDCGKLLVVIKNPTGLESIPYVAGIFFGDKGEVMIGTREPNGMTNQIPCTVANLVLIREMFTGEVP